MKAKGRDGIELSWGLAGLGNCILVDEVDRGLHDGMAGGVRAGFEKESTLPLTVVCSVAFRLDDPVLPAQLVEAEVWLLSLACLPLVTAVVFCPVGHPQGFLVLRHLGAVVAVLLTVPYPLPTAPTCYVALRRAIVKV